MLSESQAKHGKLSILMGQHSFLAGRDLGHHFLDEAMETMVGDLLKVTQLINHHNSIPGLLTASPSEWASAALAVAS